LLFKIPSQEVADSAQIDLVSLLMPQSELLRRSESGVPELEARRDFRVRTEAVFDWTSIRRFLKTCLVFFRKGLGHSNGHAEFRYPHLRLAANNRWDST
jgi:hypothetical protein